MDREALSRQFLELAHLYDCCGDRRAVLACALKALTLAPHSRDALELLGQNTGETESDPKERDGDLRRLDQRRRRLLTLVAEDPCHCAVLGDAAVTAYGDVPCPQPVVPGGRETARRFIRLRASIAEDESGGASGLLKMLEHVRSEAGLSSDELAAAERAEARDGPGDVPMLLEHACHDLGNGFYHDGCLSAAAIAYRMALRLDEDLLETHFNLALALTRMCDYTDALRELETVIRLNPALAEAHYTMGLVHEYMGNEEDALEGYRRALELDPGYRKAEEQMTALREKRSTGHTRPWQSSGTPSDEDPELDVSALIQRPRRTLDDIGGNEKAKRRLRLFASYLRGHPAWTRFGGRPPKGICLWGPPGTGKTALAEAFAGEAGCAFISVPAPSLLDKYVGNTELNVRRVFEAASRQEQGAVLFLDEIDVIAGHRVSIGNEAAEGRWVNAAVAAILRELTDRFERPVEGSPGSRFVFVCCTNMPGNLDHAFLRRLDYQVPVLLPTPREVCEILLIHVAAGMNNADEPELFTDDLRQAALVPSRTVSRYAADPPGKAADLVFLTHQIAAHRLSGAAIEEIVAQAIFARTEYAVNTSRDLGPIGVEDLLRHMRAYVNERRLDQQQGDSERPPGAPFGIRPL